MALGRRQDPDRAGGVADVEPAPALHRRYLRAASLRDQPGGGDISR